MSRPDLCRPWEHALSRRRVLGNLAGTALAGMVGSAARAADSGPPAAPDKQILFIWLDGGISQLESWDPKPNTRFGGPFRAIDTSVSGVRVSELMPNTAKVMHHLTLVRNMHTEDNNHSSGVPRILRGDPSNRGVDYPYFGSAVANLMGPGASGLPPYMWVKPGSGGFKGASAGFLGDKFGALAFGDGNPPDNLVPPESISAERRIARDKLRARFDQRYAARRRGGATEAQTHAFDMARKLMEERHLFEAANLPEADRDRYGHNDLGQHLLLARNLLEAGVRFVQVTSYGWDTHGDNFNAHASLVPKFDRAFAAVVEDLHQRGMLENTLVIAMSEFGRTPRINGHAGRDHWAEAWSLAMAGTGLKSGTVVGATEDDGVFVKDRGFDIGHAFHTWYRALGIDPEETHFMNGDQPLPIAHDEMFAIEEALS
ncbi:DUF1501 domain-containing protein [soil metagenome]